MASPDRHHESSRVESSRVEPKEEEEEEEEEEAEKEGGRIFVANDVVVVCKM